MLSLTVAGLFFSTLICLTYTFILSIASFCFVIFTSGSLRVQGLRNISESFSNCRSTFTGM